MTRRRDLLRGLGAGAALFAPFVRTLKANAAGKPGVPNLLIFYTPNGFYRSTFGSDGNDAGMTFRPSSVALEAIKSNVTVVRGLSQKSQLPNPFHDQIPRLLTCKDGAQKSTGYGPSIDHVVAKLSGSPALNLKVYRSYTSNTGTYEGLSWRDAAVPSPNINDPREAYKQVFGQFMPSGTGAETDALVAQEKSTLDFLKGEISTFRGRLAAADRPRLDTHLESIRQMELKLGNTPPGTTTCPADKAMTAGATAPPKDGGPGSYDIAAFTTHGNVQADLMLASFACGLRNAGTIMWQGAASGINPGGGSGAADDHHHCSHMEQGATAADWQRVDTWYSQRFTKLVQQTQSMGLLDNTIIVWASEITQQHAHNNCTFVVAGGKALGIQGGKTLTFPFTGGGEDSASAAANGSNRGICDLWLTVKKACGIAGDSFGDHSQGPLDGLWKPA